MQTKNLYRIEENKNHLFCNNTIFYVFLQVINTYPFTLMMVYFLNQTFNL